MSQHVVMDRDAAGASTGPTQDHLETAANQTHRVGRRLSDRVRDAWEQACAQGRTEIAARLLLCCQAIEEEETACVENRRKGVPERRNRPFTTRRRH